MMTKKYREAVTDRRLMGQIGPITRCYSAGTAFVAR